jgi:murein DD-endopeptidase MepM/ murein hydrolase activator NlpD
VTQNGDYAAMQNYFDTVKPYDFSWRSALAPMANDPNTGAFVANWVMGSHQVQAYQAGLQIQSMQTGNEAFGVLAWDANQNKYVMLDPTNMQASSGNVTGNMPTLGANQFGFFGMHTHSGSAMPSGQDYAMTQQLGLDQMVIGNNGAQAIFTNNPGNQWQGAGFLFEGPIVSNPTGGNKINPANSAVGQGNGLFRSRSGGKHDGVDISGQTKDDVNAAGSGTVVYSGWQNGYGQTVVVDHGNGRYTLYAHLDSRDVKVGQEVAAGETIGGIGTTGNTPSAAQTHLHFEIRDGKNDPKHSVDPLPILPGPYFQDGTLVSPNYVSPPVTGPYYTTPTYGTSTPSTSTQSDPISSFLSGTGGSGD